MDKLTKQLQDLVRFDVEEFGEDRVSEMYGVPFEGNVREFQERCVAAELNRAFG